MLKSAAVWMRINELPMQWVALFLERPVEEGIGCEGAAGVWHIRGRSRHIDIELRIATRSTDLDNIAVQFHDYCEFQSLVIRIIPIIFICVFMLKLPHQHIFSFIRRPSSWISLIINRDRPNGQACIVNEHIAGHAVILQYLISQNFPYSLRADLMRGRGITV